MPKKLLLADDSITIQKVVGITFAQEDFDITYVDNGVDAIKKAEEIKPDVILADIVMPQKTGYEVCESVKGSAELKHIPVLLLAGTFETFDVNRGKMVGADDYIIKPFESQALIDKVNSLLAGGGGAPEIITPEDAPAPPPVSAEPPAAPEPPTIEIPEIPAVPEIPEPPATPEPPAVDLGDLAPPADELTVASDPASDDGSAFDADSFLSASEPEISAEVPVAAPETTEAAINVDANGDGGIELASAAEIVMDAQSQIEEASDATLPPASGISLPEMDQFGLSLDDSSAGSEAALTPDLPAFDASSLSVGDSDEGEAAPLDLPPLPDDGIPATDDLDLAAAAPAIEAPAAAAPAIDEAEVKRIVEEKVREVVEKVAWEVIPELAERLIKAEIEKLSSSS